MHRPTHALLGLIVCGTSLGAMEVEDLRFGLGIGPTPRTHKGTLTDSTSGGTFATSVDYAGRTAGTFLISGTVGTLDPIGLLFGAEWRYADGESSIDSMEISGFRIPLSDVPESHYTESAGVVHAGLGWAVTERSHLELLGLVGFAAVTIDSPAFDNNDNLVSEKGYGTGVIYGCRAGWFVTFENQWQLGLEAEWTHTDARVTTDYLDGTLKSRLDTRGAGARALIGYRF